MTIPEIQKSKEALEKVHILRDYRAVLKAIKPRMREGDDKRIRLAFELAFEAHKDMRRKSGEPYIHHPLAVAKIVAEEVGLGVTSVICALLHDVVEDSEITLEEIKKDFGEEVSTIVDGLTKISKLSSGSDSIQAENYRKILLTLSDDIRVILIKIADRLHNMRTLDDVPRKNQLKISSETLFLYAPLAHRLGLYAIKGEFEDLSMKYTEAEKYKEIATALNSKKRERAKFINDFCSPLLVEIKKSGLNARVSGRPKTIFSIWNKMKKKEIEFEDVYDKFAIRIIIDSPIDKEKEDCWRAYSIITDLYHPSPNRLRDWISHPKANGYESLHTTVMGPKGKWVEVQIRTERMDIIAERGLAAHWKYKENKGSKTVDDAVENWLSTVREILKNPEANPIEFINDFKLQLYAQEIYTFTPGGDLKILPKNSTALDFAYSIHTGLGDHCIGAKVNNKLVPISHTLKNGDQIEIISSKKQKPNEDWLNFVITSRAKSKIKYALKEVKKEIGEEGKAILDRKLRQLKANFNGENVQLLANYYKKNSILDLYYDIANDKVELSKLKGLKIIGGNFEMPKPEKKDLIIHKEFKPSLSPEEISKNTELVIFGESNMIPYEFAKCCAPIPGDDVVGFLSINGMVKIHRTSCPNMLNLMSKYGYRIVKTRWTNPRKPEFLTGILINGLDDIGLMNNITQIISGELKLNMKSLSIESKDGIVEGTIYIYIQDQDQLNELINKLKQLQGIISVNRIEK
ncbi:MAG: bifunctional (p)ppGpp synthetase/guanosine-3',5'-bis(diphosphate) 3'-pyrophosphohydrolase [Bacteroidetes bacterium]|jgi:guanosine-3',5'-bis(diphosphate) 3'-pyrophosphohydrolase|nr:bifunctional (p)ppGpp synthetase/guanosine-3',5'-bis(diphosphate) 3'-pyrophosphohydrolase [Bacteroidota bacterium]MBP7255539.1 bifunctional (p)ppGpp synthetase/guanosine-3',5'-bis(diphosphate) 3'-pyrophosphohydrolase [Chitinophagales bacterium]MBK7138466.1 bifunctional (p)ppGpp synthetase/guanosine-3',5'-bis(diphosphate) 3'-pyrophosphohydrolase [Bacteroidota bacterium]MBK7641322.1 bifunctional (p)ppGpp synthetase/guanosine-3',5'-bis(diphosphate) 3'-pyrophosphohydrolase [Bacteroidota bacterium